MGPLLHVSRHGATWERLGRLGLVYLPRATAPPFTSSHAMRERERDEDERLTPVEGGGGPARIFCCGGLGDTH
jgi:hypothetical protein